MISHLLPFFEFYRFRFPPGKAKWPSCFVFPLLLKHFGISENDAHILKSPLCIPSLFEFYYVLFTFDAYVGRARCQTGH